VVFNSHKFNSTEALQKRHSPGLCSRVQINSLGTGSGGLTISFYSGQLNVEHS
jgi:hypothetical protein